jgi:hypothetical protein
MSESTLSRSAGSPDAFREMAHEVNPISGDTHYTTSDLVDKALGEQPPARTQQPIAKPEEDLNLNRLLTPFTQFPEKLQETVGAYPVAVVASLALLLAAPLVAILLSLLATIHSVPLLGSFFQLVGLSYTVWFTYQAWRQSLSRPSEPIL